ncbi:MAG TPA: cation:proton antiporter, partial [Nitrososphaerales archaeon]|nr:cation:proton antiporter [Nitrososphaerales archaeon]
VLLVLALAVLAGEAFEQFGIPAVAGELLSGMILGPTVLGAVTSNLQTEAISSIALFFVVFLIGFEMTTGMVKRQPFPASLVSATSFVLPLVVTTTFAVLILPFGLQADAIVALGISVPSISIISILVMELDLLEKKSGQLIIASVTITDIVAFLILAAVTESATSTYGVLAYTGVFVVAFIALDWTLNSHPEMLQRLIDKGAKVVKREDISFAVLLVCGLFTAALLQAIGVSYILGSFLAGLIVHDGLIGKRPFRRIADTLSRMNRGFLHPALLRLRRGRNELLTVVLLPPPTAWSYAPGFDPPFHGLDLSGEQEGTERDGGSEVCRISSWRTWRRGHSDCHRGAF